MGNTCAFTSTLGVSVMPYVLAVRKECCKSIALQHFTGSLSTAAKREKMLVPASTQGYPCAPHQSRQQALHLQSAQRWLSPHACMVRQIASPSLRISSPSLFAINTFTLFLSLSTHIDVEHCWQMFQVPKPLLVIHYTITFSNGQFASVFYFVSLIENYKLCVAFNSLNCL